MLDPSQPDPAAIPPELAGLPGYQLDRRLGQGGMGAVYLARNRLMDRPEVLKVLSPAFLQRPGARDRFQQEVRNAARLQHPNIVTAYSCLPHGDLLVFAMEYVDGKDLAQVVKEGGPLPVAHACYYAQQAARGLQHAHEKGMVHRDVKPANLMLAREGKRHVVKVLDFGLAKLVWDGGDANAGDGDGPADPGLTGAGRMLGTPDYVAPEQTLDAAKADIRADIYSLGCTLYYLLAGRPPFHGNSLAAILEAHHRTEATPLNLVRADVPEELASVVARMMAKDPARRYQTPLDVALALAPFVQPGGRREPVVSTEVSTAGASSRAEEVRPPTVVPDPAPLPAVPRVAPEEAPAPSWSNLGTEVEAPPPKKPVVRRRRVGWLIGGGLAGTLLVGLVLAGAAGAFRAKPRQDTVSRPDPPTVIATPRTGNPQPSEPKTDPPRAAVMSEWVGTGVARTGKLTRPLFGTWTFTERQGPSFKATWRGNGDFNAIFEGTITPDGRVTIQAREVLAPTPSARESYHGSGEIGMDRMTVNLDDPSFPTSARVEFKVLPDRGDGFRFPGRWKVYHRPSGWVGFRTITVDHASTDRIPGRAPWARDGGLIIVHFPGGGREWLVIDPDRPNELTGTSGQQHVTWVRQ